jgi:superfamily II RNA helicase
MVILCNTRFPEQSKYNTFFHEYSYPLSDFQKHAIKHIVDGNHVLITAHTGSGKTLPAEFAINYFHCQSKKIIYTSPIKALSNQKYYEFSNKYPHITFGLFTGDIKTNPDADVLIMTTEILMNYLFIQREQTNPILDFQIDIQNDLACVIFDEVHYINDAHRGQNWEKTILMLPRNIQMVMLSATIDSPELFAKWCEKDGDSKKVAICSTNHRVVPLTHYTYMTTTESLFKKLKDKVLEKQIREKTNKLLVLQNEKGQFQENTLQENTKTLKTMVNKSIYMKRKWVLNNLCDLLKQNDMLPAIAFVFSRKNVELFAKEITTNLLEDDSKIPYIIQRECHAIIRKLPNHEEYMTLPEYQSLVKLLEKGIGIHHSGMIPILREIVELFISKKYIKLLFATESFAIGLDCPIKTAIFTGLTKFDGTNERYLLSHEYTQMAGRAGRRGIDTVGNVIHCANLINIPSIIEYKSILCGKPQKLVSKFTIAYTTILNILQTNGKADYETFYAFVNKSMMYGEHVKEIKREQECIQEMEQVCHKKQQSPRITPETICHQYMEWEKNKSMAKQRKTIERDMDRIKEEYKFLLADVESIKEIIQLENTIEEKKRELEYKEKKIWEEIKNICFILHQTGFITRMGDDFFYLTHLGEHASCINEIHPLVLVKVMYEEWNYFTAFQIKQLVGLFSCFTGIRIANEQSSLYPDIEDTFLKSSIIRVSQVYDNYKKLEENKNVYMKEEDVLVYDIIDETMEWCDCETEEECKYFIQTKLAAKDISIGDFTKALLKINAIASQFQKIAINQVDLLYKLGKIGEMTLKHVVTCQSLYV